MQYIVLLPDCTCQQFIIEIRRLSFSTRNKNSYIKKKTKREKRKRLNKNAIKIAFEREVNSVIFKLPVYALGEGN